MLGEGASTQLNLVTGASASSTTPDFGESCDYSPRPLVVGKRIFTAYGVEVWGADDLGRTWTEVPGPPTPTDPPQRRLVFPLSDGGLLTVLEVILDDDLSSTPPRLGRADPGGWATAPALVSTGIESTWLLDPKTAAWTLGPELPRAWAVPHLRPTLCADRPGRSMVAPR